MLFEMTIKIQDTISIGYLTHNLFFFIDTLLQWHISKASHEFQAILITSNFSMMPMIIYEKVNSFTLTSQKQFIRGKFMTIDQSSCHFVRNEIIHTSFDMAISQCHIYALCDQSMYIYFVIFLYFLICL